MGVMAVCSRRVTASSLTATQRGVEGRTGLPGLVPFVLVLAPDEVAAVVVVEVAVAAVEVGGGAGGGRAGIAAGNRAAPKCGHLRRHVRQMRTHSAWLRPRSPIHFSCRLSSVLLRELVQILVH